MGIPLIEVPQTYWAHLKLPFEWKRLHESRAEVAVGQGQATS